jgi:hypothetical protein
MLPASGYLLCFFPLPLWGGVELSLLLMRPLRHIVPALDVDGWLWVWNSWWNARHGKLKYSEKTCPSAGLPTTNLTCPDSGLNLNHSNGKLATNLLSYGTVLLAWLTLWPQRFRWCVSPKLWTFSKLHDVTTRNTMFFLASAKKYYNIFLLDLIMLLATLELRFWPYENLFHSEVCEVRGSLGGYYSDLGHLGGGGDLTTSS